MKKTIWLWIGLIALVIVAIASVWLVLNTTTKQETPATSDESTMNMDQPAATLPDAGQGTDTPTSSALSGNIAVTIQDMAYSPAKVTIKKGSTVIWTNQDSVGHNAVGDSAQDGGLPTTADLLSKGKTQSHTFNTVGIFTYHCMPHSFMHGTVEVVE